MGSLSTVGKGVAMAGKGCEGDWEYKSSKCPVPVKLTVKKMIGEDWMVACMIPRGNMIDCMLREEEGVLKQINFSMTERESPLEIIETECLMAEFLKAGVTSLQREGETLKIQAGGSEMIFDLDK